MEKPSGGAWEVVPLAAEDAPRIRPLERTRVTRLALLALGAAALACATAGPAAAPGPPPFQGVRRALLVRWVESPEDARRPDPVQALARSLVERGVGAPVVNVGPGAQERRRDLERLHEDLRWAAEDAAAGTRPRRASEAVAARVAAALEAAGADALVLSYRLDPRLAGAPPLPPGAGPFGSYDRYARGPAARAARPQGALALVNRAGTVLSIGWSPDADLPDPALAVNAAEAVDRALRVLAGGRAEDPDALDAP